MKEKLGTIWQDDSSINEDGLVNFYVFNGKEFIFLEQGKPLMFPYPFPKNAQLDMFS